MKYLNKRCFICRMGLNNGIIINGRVICNKCEEDIVRINITSWSYKIYVQKIRKVLFD